ncbi:hypothetical protein GT347_15735 [Xylophilus rhododendri]|uniref:F-box domain-containing protein n=1 Tax=Xylophilus rhododendri TaxID=2697032 RepID=A0A857J981_9BURK|nr:F-box protein [Xylophilus rhododendri]QHI99298.1 hypothetical protein GT347_15735 [Xylophilus rhododendri]
MHPAFPGPSAILAGAAASHRAGAHDPPAPAADADGRAAPPQPALDALALLPVELWQQVFSHLGPRELAAVAGTSRGLRACVAQERARSFVVQGLPCAADLPAALERALWEIAGIDRLPLARPALQVATLAVLGLPPWQRHAWIARLGHEIDAKGFPRNERLRLRRLGTAVAILGRWPARADSGFAAFGCLIDGCADQSDAVQDTVYRAIAGAFWAGALGPQGAAGTPHDPRVLPMFVHLLERVRNWPDERAIQVLAPLLLGMHSLHPGERVQGLTHAWPAILRLKSTAWAVAMECTYWGGITLDPDPELMMVHTVAALMRHPVRREVQELVGERRRALRKVFELNRRRTLQARQTDEARPAKRARPDPSGAQA